VWAELSLFWGGLGRSITFFNQSYHRNQLRILPEILKGCSRGGKVVLLFVLRHFSTNPYRKRFAEDTQSTVYGRDLEVIGGSTSRAKRPSQFAFATTAASGSAMTVLWDVPFCWIPAVIMSIVSRPLRATSSDSR
jgi:hypothetical protein